MSFALHIHDTEHSQNFEEVASFVGEDQSGHFGLLSGHARFMTSLIMGLARFKQTDGEWTYIATSGTLLYFENNRLTLSTRHFVVDRDYTRISLVLEQQIAEEERLLAQQKQSLRRMEEAVLRRLWELNRKAT